MKNFIKSIFFISLFVFNNLSFSMEQAEQKDAMEVATIVRQKGQKDYNYLHLNFDEDELSKNNILFRLKKLAPNETNEYIKVFRIKENPYLIYWNQTDEYMHDNTLILEYEVEKNDKKSQFKFFLSTYGKYELNFKPDNELFYLSKIYTR